MHFSRWNNKYKDQRRYFISIYTHVNILLLISIDIYSIYIFYLIYLYYFKWCIYYSVYGKLLRKKRTRIYTSFVLMSFPFKKNWSWHALHLYICKKKNKLNFFVSFPPRIHIKYLVICKFVECFSNTFLQWLQVYLLEIYPIIFKKYSFGYFQVSDDSARRIIDHR